MYDALELARSRHNYASRNYAGFNNPADDNTTKVAGMAARKGVGGAIAALLAYWNTTSGMPEILGVGLDAAIAGAGIAAELAGIFYGVGKGGVGDPLMDSAIQGAVQGAGDAGWYHWMIDQAHTYAAAKMSKGSTTSSLTATASTPSTPAAKSATAGVGFDYRQLPNQRPQYKTQAQYANQRPASYVDAWGRRYG